MDLILYREGERSLKSTLQSMYGIHNFVIHYHWCEEKHYKDFL